MKYKKMIIILFLMLFLAISFSSACSCGSKSPWLLQDVCWYSEDPVIELVQKDSSDTRGFLMKDGEKIEVQLIWSPTFSLYIYEINSDKISDEGLLLGGKFDFDGTKVTISVNVDNVFYNKYKEIVLYRKAIDET